MIEFHLDGRSGVAPYMQLIQQVRQALRLGLLARATSCRPSRRSWAGWPSTRTRCSRRTASWSTRVWSRPGRASARSSPRTLADVILAAHGPLRARPAALARPRPAGGPGRREHRGAVRQHLSRTTAQEGHSVSAAHLRPQGLSKRYGEAPGARSTAPRHPGRPRRRPRRPQRRRQDHAAPPRPGQLAADGRQPSACSAPTRPQRGSSWPGSGFVAQDTPVYAHADRGRPPAAGRAAQPELGRRRGRGAASRRSASTRSRRRASSPAASARSWR